MENMEYLTFTLMMIIIYLILKNWEPPIKKQYIIIMLLSVSSLIAYFRGLNVSYAFAISGTIYYKREIVDEVLAIKNNLLDMKTSKGE